MGDKNLPLIDLPPPPKLSVLSATPPAGISLSLPSVLMAITPRT